MVDSLGEYADLMEAGEYEDALEAADAIGSEDGEGCSICEHLSSSLAAAVAYSMWFPGEQEEIAEQVSTRAREYRAELVDELE